MPIAREILDMLDLGRKPSQLSNSSFFYIEISKDCKGQVPIVRWVSTAPSIAIPRNDRSVGTLLKDWDFIKTQDFRGVPTER